MFAKIRINKEVAARVRSGSFKVDDPCVACGMIFVHCNHTVEQTMAVISAVRANPKLWRNMQCRSTQN